MDLKQKIEQAIERLPSQEVFSTSWLRTLTGAQGKKDYDRQANVLKQLMTRGVLVRLRQGEYRKVLAVGQPQEQPVDKAVDGPTVTEIGLGVVALLEKQHAEIKKLHGEVTEVYQMYNDLEGDYRRLQERCQKQAELLASAGQGQKRVSLYELQQICAGKEAKE